MPTQSPSRVTFPLMDVGLLSDETLLQQSQLMQLNPPNSFDLRILREWLRRQNGGEGLFLSAIESKMWDETNAAELVTLTSRHNGVDTLTKWIYGSLFPWLYTRWGIGFKVEKCRSQIMFLWLTVQFSLSGMKNLARPCIARRRFCLPATSSASFCRHSFQRRRWLFY